jgi:hypothetical protein
MSSREHEFAYVQAQVDFVKNGGRFVKYGEPFDETKIMQTWKALQDVKHRDNEALKATYAVMFLMFCPKAVRDEQIRVLVHNPCFFFQCRGIDFEHFDPILFVKVWAEGMEKDGLANMIRSDDGSRIIDVEWLF